MITRYRYYLILGLLLAAGCGQSGPLYLPGNPSEVKTNAPPPPSQAEPEDNDEDEDQDSQSEH